MSRTLLIVSVGLAAYGVLSTLAACAVAVVWRRWHTLAALPPVPRAARLATLRFAPAATGAVLTCGLVVPVFVAFEPVRDYEPVGPLLAVLATFGAGLVVASLARAVVTGLRTYLVERAWLRSATRLDVDPPAGVPAYIIDTLAPIVALVGVFSPRLVAARAVVDACSHHELSAIVAHERGHLLAHDNLKRWLMACAPDVLRWTPLHRQIGEAWRDAAEDAADDFATAGRDLARVDLAALLVKVARLADAAPVPAAVSPFADTDGLERRVRRLLSQDASPSADTGPRFRTLLTVATVGVLGVVAVSGNLQQVYDLVEFAVRIGR
jgi:Zn-dependent protease with chaperone function